MVLLELYSGGGRLGYFAGWRWKKVAMVCVSEFCLPLTGGSSPPYKGSGLGFGFTRMLQVYPYDISYGASRLQLDHHDV